MADPYWRHLGEGNLGVLPLVSVLWYLSICQPLLSFARRLLLCLDVLDYVEAGAQKGSFHIWRTSM